MSTQFYRVTDGDDLLWVVGLIPQRGLWAWIPNTGEWHHHRDLETDFATERELTYTPISAADAAALVRTAPRIDERAGMGAWVAQQFRDQGSDERISSSAIGIPQGLEPRPARGDLSVRLASSGTWVVVKVYPATQTGDVAARKLVSRLRSGKVAQSLRPLGPLDARQVPEADSWVVEARRRAGADAEQLGPKSVARRRKAV
ncbi:hypothetical protein [Cellulomonas hominis]